MRIYDGASLSIIYSFRGDGFGERFGASLAGPGDMDGDGIPELAVGAPCPRLDRPGYARVFAGADASILFTFGGQHTWELFGASLAAAGDADGDGREDLLVGAPLSRTGDPKLEAAVDHACGAATLFSGKSGLPLFVLASGASEDRFGTAVAQGPDLDGDGAPDLLVGATQRLLPRGGYVRAFSSRTGVLLATWTGVGSGDQFGAALARLSGPGGRQFVLVGAPTDKNVLPDGQRGVSVGSASLIEVLRAR